MAKRPLRAGYTFSPATRKIDFSGRRGFSVASLIAIINLASGDLVYVPGQPGLGYSDLTGTVLTLDVDTRGMAATDPLLVLYDDGGALDTLDVLGTLAPGQTKVAVPADPDRQLLVISNNGAGPLTYRFGSDPSASAGHNLAPGETHRFDGRVPVEEVRVFAGEATSFTVTAG